MKRQIWKRIAEISGATEAAMKKIEAAFRKTFVEPGYRFSIHTEKRIGKIIYALISSSKDGQLWFQIPVLIDTHEDKKKIVFSRFTNSRTYGGVLCENAPIPSNEEWVEVEVSDSNDYVISTKQKDKYYGEAFSFCHYQFAGGDVVLSLEDGMPVYVKR